MLLRAFHSSFTHYVLNVEVTWVLSSLISSSANPHPRENCSNFAAKAGFLFASELTFDFRKAFHCLKASLSCSTRRFSSAERFFRDSSVAFSKVFSRLWLSIRRCWTSLYFRDNCLWCEAAWTPLSTEYYKIVFY